MKTNAQTQDLRILSCPICAHRFDPATPAAQSKCAECSLHRGSACHTVCCPNCHHTFVPSGHSSLARAATRLLRRIGITVTA